MEVDVHALRARIPRVRGRDLDHVRHGLREPSHVGSVQEPRAEAERLAPGPGRHREGDPHGERLPVGPDGLVGAEHFDRDLARPSRGRRGRPREPRQGRRGHGQGRDGIRLPDAGRTGRLHEALEYGRGPGPRLPVGVDRRGRRRREGHDQGRRQPSRHRPPGPSVQPLVVAQHPAHHDDLTASPCVPADPAGLGISSSRIEAPLLYLVWRVDGGCQDWLRLAGYFRRVALSENLASPPRVRPHRRGVLRVRG